MSEPIPSGTWLPPSADLPTYRVSLAAAWARGELHAIGGDAGDGSPPTGSHDVFDPSTGVWASGLALPTARSSAAVTVVGSDIYVIGGFTWTAGGSRQPLASNEMYDHSSGTWQTRAPMPTPRGLAAIGEIDGLVYVVGGQAPDSCDLNQVYDPDADHWAPAAPLPSARAGMAAGVVESGLYLCGGSGDGEKVLDMLQLYDPVKDAWSTLPPMPTARWLAAGCDAQGLVFALGGSSYKAEVPMTTNEAYDPRKGVWLTGPPIPPTDINWSVAAGGETGTKGGAVHLLAGTVEGTVENLVYELS
jgi:hypothetical protein